MRDFGSDNRRGGRDSFRGGSGGRDSRRFEMHDAVCDECGKNCQVPFRPSGGKPIYCSECFENKGGRGGNRGGGRDFSRRSAGPSGPDNSAKLIERIDLVNTKLDAIIRLMSKGGEEKRSKPEMSKVKKRVVKKAKKAKKAKKKK